MHFNILVDLINIIKIAVFLRDVFIILLYRLSNESANGSIVLGTEQVYKSFAKNTFAKKIM